RDYIKANKLNVTTHSQGRFCPTGSVDPNCAGGQDGDSGKTPTVDFITKAIAEKKDVELCFAWPAKPGTPPSPPGAHCVFAVGYRFVNGYLTVDFTHDLSQGNDGGVDFEDGGHMSFRIGVFNNQLWIRSFPDRPSLLTHVITEENK